MPDLVNANEAPAPENPVLPCEQPPVVPPPADPAPGALDATAWAAANAETQPPVLELAQTFGPCKVARMASGLINVAQLDATAMLVGFAEVEDWRDGDPGIPVPEGCDLATGQYRWNQELVRFDPVHEQDLAIEKVNAPIPLKAIGRALLDLQAQGFKFNKYTVDWLKFFKGSIDNDG